MSTWFLKLKNQESGPFETDDLLRLIPPSKIANAQLRSQPTDPWRPLSSFPELLLALPPLANETITKPIAVYNRPWFALLVLLSLSVVVFILLARPKKRFRPSIPSVSPETSSEPVSFQSLREHQDLALQEQHEKRKKELLQLTPSEREQELTSACASTCDELDLTVICQTASSPEEQAILQQKAKSLRKSWLLNQPKIAQKAREDYAKTLATAMLNQHMNHRSVEALGPEKTLLQVSAIFCSPRFIQDAQSGELRNLAKALGFKKIQCKSRETTWSTDL